MSALVDKIECDRCGKDLGNGALDKCVVISRADFSTGLVENIHLCIEREQTEDGTVKEVKGCAAEVVFPELKHYTKRLKALEAERRKAERQGGSSAGGGARADASGPRKSTARSKSGRRGRSSDQGG